MKNLLLHPVALLVLYCLGANVANAQSSSGTRFSSINQVGLVTGDNGQSGAIQTINGVVYKSWFGGVGVGIDYYGLRSIPLFAEVRKNLLKSSNTPFIYADGGVNFSSSTKAQRDSKGFLGTDKMGAFYEGGAGVSMRGKRNRAVNLSLGYSFKQVFEKSNMFTIWSWPTTTPAYEYYNYKMRRIIVKLGLQL